MAQNNFILDLIAGLNKTRSKQQIKADVKALGDIYVKLIGNLNMTKTRLWKAPILCMRRIGVLIPILITDKY